MFFWGVFYMVPILFSFLRFYDCFLIFPTFEVLETLRCYFGLRVSVVILQLSICFVALGFFS